MANRIRAHFKREIDALLPVLHETYRLIGVYQRDRSDDNAGEP